MGHPSSASDHGDVLRQAAHWFSVLHAGEASHEEQRRWRDWLGDAGSPQRQAWAQVEQISQRFVAVENPAARTALHRAAGRATRRGVLRSVAAIGGTGLLIWGGSRTHTWQDWQADYATATGDIREIALPDGSRLWLDTDSAVNIAFDNELRRIVLLRGDISITTAHALGQRQSDSRPLVVDGLHGRMCALGTRFSVRQRPSDSLLSVFEGAVQIQLSGTDGAIDGTTRVVPAGQQVSFTRDRIGSEQSADLARQAWTQGLLVATDMPLSRLVAELARYRPGHLACTDAVADLRLVGVYSLRNTDQALDALAAALPVKIVRRTRWWVTIDAA